MISPSRFGRCEYRAGYPGRPFRVFVKPWCCDFLESHSSQHIRSNIFEMKCPTSHHLHAPQPRCIGARRRATCLSRPLLSPPPAPSSLAVADSPAQFGWDARGGVRGREGRREVCGLFLQGVGCARTSARGGHASGGAMVSYQAGALDL